jgi:hypothetical protein
MLLALTWAAGSVGCDARVGLTGNAENPLGAPCKRSCKYASAPFERKWWAGTGLNRRHQGFQTRLIRSLRGIDLQLCFGIRPDSDA